MQFELSVITAAIRFAIEAVNETGPAPFYNRVVRQISACFAYSLRYYEGSIVIRCLY